MIDRIEKAVKFITALSAIAVGIAHLTTLGADPSKPTHYALYLLRQLWIEVLVLAVGVACYLSLKRTVVPLHASGVFSKDSLTKAIAAPRAWFPGAVLFILTLNLLWPTFYLVRARIIFWRDLCKTAYVENYKVRVDVLARTGRIQEAYGLTQVVARGLGESFEAEYLDRRLTTLEGVRKRSDQLRLLGDAGPWNAVTEGQRFFELAEGVRINPQNYSVAERLRGMLKRLEESLNVDAKAICQSQGNLRQFHGYATALLEAHERWAEFGSQGNCMQMMEKLRNAWFVDGVDEVLELSEAAKAPVSDREWEQFAQLPDLGEFHWSYPSFLDLDSLRLGD